VPRRSRQCGRRVHKPPLVETGGRAVRTKVLQNYVTRVDEVTEYSVDNLFS
jgi:hypothetical protein